MPLTISEATFTRVMDYLDALHYSGPVSLACDDTKLQSGLRLYWDNTAKGYFLVGGTGGPLSIPDPKQVSELMNDPTMEKGTKVI